MLWRPAYGRKREYATRRLRWATHASPVQTAGPAERVRRFRRWAKSSFAPTQGLNRPSRSPGQDRSLSPPRCSPPSPRFPIRVVARGSASPAILPRRLRPSWPMDTVLAMAEWGASQSPQLLQTLGFPMGQTPHQSTLARLFQRLNPSVTPPSGARSLLRMRRDPRYAAAMPAVDGTAGASKPSRIRPPGSCRASLPSATTRASSSPGTDYPRWHQSRGRIDRRTAPDRPDRLVRPRLHRRRALLPTSTLSAGRPCTRGLPLAGQSQPTGPP